MISGTLKSVAATTSEITLVRETGAELVLELGAGAQVFAGEAVTPVGDLDGYVGRSIEVNYAAADSIPASERPRMRRNGNTSGSAVGVLDMVGVLSGMVAVLTETDGALVLRVTPETTILVNNAVVVLAELGRYVGKPLSVEFDQEASVAIAILVD